MPRKLGDMLREGRGRRAIPDMAKALNVNKNTLGDYERGKRPPDVDFLTAFASLTGTSFLELLRQQLLDINTTESIAALDEVNRASAPAAPAVDWQLVENCATVLEELIQEHNLVWTPADKARMLRLMCEYFTALGRFDRSKAAEIVAPFAA